MTNPLIVVHSNELRVISLQEETVHNNLNSPLIQKAFYCSRVVLP